MLVRVDPRQDATTVLSIPRDLRVAIPGHGDAQDQRRLRARRPEARRSQTIKRADRAEGPPRRQRELPRLPRGDQPRSAASTPTSTAATSTPTAACRSASATTRSTSGPATSGCAGIDALDYVRYRHADSDLVRAARQQDFLRAAKDQVSTSRLIDDLERLGRDRRARDADRREPALEGRVPPLRQARAASRPTTRCARSGSRRRSCAATRRRATSSRPRPAAVARRGRPVPARRRPRSARARARRRKRRPRRAPRGARSRPRAPGSSNARAQGERLVRDAGRRARRLGFPVRFPSHLTPQRPVRGPAADVRAARPRRYPAPRLPLRRGREPGRRAVLRRPGHDVAQPAAAGPSDRRAKGRRPRAWNCSGRAAAYASSPGARIAPRTGSPTRLTLELTNDEMLALAASLTTAK